MKGFLRDRERTARALAWAGVAAALVGLAHLATAPRDAGGFTEFYVLDEEGLTRYPVAPPAAADVRLLVGVGNHEGRPMEYRVVARLGAENATGVVVDEWTVAAPPSGKVETPWSFRAPAEPGPHRLDLLLHLGEEPAPYRSLTLRFVVG